MAFLDIKESIINFFYPNFDFFINDSVSKIDTPINETNDLITFLNSVDEAVIYGYAAAGWGVVMRLARNTIKNVYDYSLTSEPNKTLHGRSFININSPTLHQTCKTTVTAIVVENCLRAEENMPLIPVLFCLTSTNQPSHLPVEVIANKNDSKADYKGSTSNSELRRIYKLCTDSALSFEVREIAKKTFYFAHIILDKGAVIAIRKTAAPWENTVEDPNKNLKWVIARKIKEMKKTNKTESNWREWFKDPQKTQMLLA